MRRLSCCLLVTLLLSACKKDGKVRAPTEGSGHVVPIMVGTAIDVASRAVPLGAGLVTGRVVTARRALDWCARVSARQV